MPKKTLIISELLKENPEKLLTPVSISYVPESIIQRAKGGGAAIAEAKINIDVMVKTNKEFIHVLESLFQIVNDKSNMNYTEKRYLWMSFFKADKKNSGIVLWDYLYLKTFSVDDQKFDTSLLNVLQKFDPNKLNIIRIKGSNEGVTIPVNSILFNNRLNSIGIVGQHNNKFIRKIGDDYFIISKPPEDLENILNAYVGEK